VFIPHSKSNINSSFPSSINDLESSEKISVNFEHKTNVSKYDVATFYEKSLSLNDNEKHDLIENVFTPNSNYVFPKSQSKRKFLHKYLLDFPWLRYSPSLNGGLCLPCVLFARETPSKLQNTENLVTKPVFPSADIVPAFRRHEKSKNGLHSVCMHSYQMFLKCFSGKSVTVATAVNNIRKEKIQENRLILHSLVDTILLCGHLGLPTRGHRDDSSYHPEAGMYSTKSGIGNFIELVNYGIRRGDKVLKDHYINHSKNASYLSKETQNDLIKYCGEVISDDIIAEVKANSFFSILADEAMDCSGKEQLSFVLRYVDSLGNIKEDFLGFLHLEEGLTGEALANTIMTRISDIGLDIKNCRGQGYDGAGSVAGEKNGCSAHILRQSHKALYTHCFSHRLNLSVQKACKIVSVSNMMEVVRKISEFFRFSQQRQQVLETFINEYDHNYLKVKLQDVCKTRWIQRIAGLQTFIDLFVPIWRTLDAMRMNLSGKFNLNTKTNAFSFYKAIDNFDFIVNLIMTYKVFDLTMDVTVLLQSKKNDIADGIHMINSLLKLLAETRKDVDAKHAEWYHQAVDLANKLDIPVQKLRTTGRQTLRANHPADDVSHFYKLSLTDPLLDYLSADLNARFSEKSLISYFGLYLIPSKIVSMHSDRDNGIVIKSLHELLIPFIQFYKDDFPSPHRIKTELELWETYWVTNTETCPSNITSTLKAVRFDGFENIKVAFRILATLPITSCECERSFSGMRRLKNYLRSTMTNERLNGLALMNFHQDKIPKTDKVINKFAAAKLRRLEFNL